MITENDLNWWLRLECELDWLFATTYAATAPHEYVIPGRTPGISQEDGARAAHVIRTYGEPMKFYKETRIYLVTPMGWKHWDMQGKVIDDGTVSVINRGRIDHVYGVQNSPITASGHRSAYDGTATVWDREYSLTPAERQETESLAREVFGDRWGRTLDVGCGTGFPLDSGFVEPARYVGIDPSTSTLNALLMKHPLVAALHPMHFAEAEQRRVLCGTRFDSVVALGGSASYLTPSDIRDVRARAKRDVLLMHYASVADAVVPDLTEEQSLASLRAATDLGKYQTRIGRFIATVIAGPSVDE